VPAYSKQHVTVRAHTRCRLAVLPRDQPGSQALPGVAEQQTSRLQAHNTSPAGGDPCAGESAARPHDGRG
jgi:hypothetical protein